MHTGLFQSCPTLCNPVDCGLPGFSVKETVLQAGILECIGHPLLEHYISYYPSRQPPEYLVLPEPLQPKKLHHLHTWPSQGQTEAPQGSPRS